MFCNKRHIFRKLSFANEHRKSYVEVVRENRKKCNQLYNANKKVSLNISNEKIGNSKCLALLSINVDYRFIFHTYISIKIVERQVTNRTLFP